MTDWETEGDWSRERHAKKTSRYKYGETRSEVITNSNTIARGGGVYVDGQKAHISFTTLLGCLFTAIQTIYSQHKHCFVCVSSTSFSSCSLQTLTSSRGQTDQNVLLIRLSCAISLTHFRTADMKVQLSQSYSKLLYFRMTWAKEGGLMFKLRYTETFFKC